jgi:hypothetical protein
MLQVPQGQATGCLPRDSKYGEICAKLEDSIDIISRDKWGDLIGDVLLRPYVYQIFSQGSVGSCATESTSGAWSIINEVAGKPSVLLNPWSLYAFTSGGRDRGSNVDRNLERARDVGILPESIWPRRGPNKNPWNRKPPAELFDKHACRIDEFYDIASIDEVGTALLRGFPVVYGWSGHSCVLTSLRDRNTAVYANSWGTSWGDKGFGTISLNKINFGYGAFAVRTIK